MFKMHGNDRQRSSFQCRKKARFEDEKKKYKIDKFKNMIKSGEIYEYSHMGIRDGLPFMWK